MNDLETNPPEPSAHRSRRHADARNAAGFVASVLSVVKWLLPAVGLGVAGLVVGVTFIDEGDEVAGLAVVNAEPGGAAAGIVGDGSNIVINNNNYDAPTPAEPPDSDDGDEAGDEPKPDKEEVRELLLQVLAEEASDANRGEPSTIEAATAPIRVVHNDDPALFDLDADTEDGEYSWFEPPPEINELGWGENGFRFTVAIGNSGDDALDNFARWEFDPVHGEFDIQAWIPAAWASAEIQYLMWVDSNNDGRFSEQENFASPWLDQSQELGWASLGTYSLDGRVRVEVQDTRSRDDWRNRGDEIDGVIASRMAVDAIRLVEVADR